MKESIIYAYRVRTDKGNAPCINDLNGRPTGLLSLSVCKGGRLRGDEPVSTGLRHTIGKLYKDAINTDKTDVYLLGVYRGKLPFDMLLYFAKITKVLTMEEYFAVGGSYKGRQDDWFDYANGKFEYHGPHDDDTQARDLAGKYALVSERFAYWGKDCKPIGDLAEILPERQESKHYSNNDDADNYERIMAFVNGVWDFNTIIQGEPNESPDGEGSEV